MNTIFRSWLRFNFVGLLGMAVQLSVLVLSKNGLGFHYLTATAIAVESAVLHNFCWHERWTWIERTRTLPAGLSGRLLRFHLANGFVSILGNVAVMWLLVSKFHIGYFVANILAIATCSLANFWTSERLVFRHGVMLGLAATILAPPPALYEDSVADKLIRSATESSYMLHLPEARAAAHELQQRYPDHPAGFLIEAETYWWEAQADPNSSKIENDYFRAQQIAQQKAEHAIQTSKYYQPELLSYLASAYASYARFQITQKNAYFAAMRAGLRAHEYAEQVYALDKNYYDIYVGLGAFNYFAGTLPAPIKPFAWLLGATGDKNLGVSQFQTAMDRARYSRTEARIVYYSALFADKQYTSAFPILEKLISEYPDNFVFYDWAEVWFGEQRKNSDGTGYFEQMFEKQVSRSPLMAQYALLEKAALQADGGLRAEARQTLQRIRAIPHSDQLLLGKVDVLLKSTQ